MYAFKIQIPLRMPLFLVPYFLSVTVSCQTLSIPQISILVFSFSYSTYSSLGCDLVLLFQPSLYAGISESASPTHTGLHFAPYS